MREMRDAIAAGGLAEFSPRTSPQAQARGDIPPL